MLYIIIVMIIHVCVLHVPTYAILFKVRIGTQAEVMHCTFYHQSVCLHFF